MELIEPTLSDTITETIKWSNKTLVFSRGEFLILIKV